MGIHSRLRDEQDQRVDGHRGPPLWSRRRARVNSYPVLRHDVVLGAHVDPIDGNRGGLTSNRCRSRCTTATPSGIPPGVQRLRGAEVLAFSRDRHSLRSGRQERGRRPHADRRAHPVPGGIREGPDRAAPGGSAGMRAARRTCPLRTSCGSRSSAPCTRRGTSRTSCCRAASGSANGLLDSFRLPPRWARSSGTRAVRRSSAAATALDRRPRASRSRAARMDRRA